MTANARTISHGAILVGIAQGIRSHAFLSTGEMTPFEYDEKQYEWAQIALTVLASVEEWTSRPHGSAGQYREFLARCGISDRVIGRLIVSEEDPLAFY